MYNLATHYKNQVFIIFKNVNCMHVDDDVDDDDDERKKKGQKLFKSRTREEIEMSARCRTRKSLKIQHKNRQFKELDADVAEKNTLNSGKNHLRH